MPRIEWPISAPSTFPRRLACMPYLPVYRQAEYFISAYRKMRYFHAGAAGWYRRRAKSAADGGAPSCRSGRRTAPPGRVMLICIEISRATWAHDAKADIAQRHRAAFRRARWAQGHTTRLSMAIRHATQDDAAYHNHHASWPEAGRRHLGFLYAAACAEAAPDTTRRRGCREIPI